MKHNRIAPPAVQLPYTELDEALDDLNDAIAAAYAALVRKEAERPHPRPEHERRESALQSIDEILSWRPLSSFSALHLELLEMLFAYWREIEVAGNPRAPEPDPMHRAPQQAYVRARASDLLRGSARLCPTHPRPLPLSAW